MKSRQGEPGSQEKPTHTVSTPSGHREELVRGSQKDNSDSGEENTVPPICSVRKNVWTERWSACNILGITGAAAPGKESVQSDVPASALRFPLSLLE